MADPTADPLTAARDLLRAHPLVDGHNDLPWRIRTEFEGRLDRVDLAARVPAAHTDLPRLRRGGVGAQFWSVYVPGRLAGDAAVAATLEQVDLVHRMIRRYPDDLELALTADDVARAFARGRIASLLGAEGGHSIAGSLGVLRALHRLGVRYLTLTHNVNVPWADAATDEPALGGLSAFGREVVREMQRIGMLVDLSHTSAATARDALAVAGAPVLFSHSGARALCDHPRNVDDDVLRRLAANGGVCMVTFVPAFVSPGGRATLAGVADHVEHVRRVAGVEHVGLGGDFDGTPELPDGLEDVACYPALVAELLARGWSRDDCVRLVGGNVLRVMRAAEAFARSAARASGCAGVPPGAEHAEHTPPPDDPRVPRPEDAEPTRSKELGSPSPAVGEP